MSKSERFPDEIHLVDAGMRGSSRIFRLEKCHRFISSRGIITAPAGTLTDGASIPRIFWNLLYPYGPFFSAAITHDFLYSSRNDRFNRLESDQIFLEAMTVLGIGWIKRTAIYRAVRLGGKPSFKGQIK